MPRAPWRRCRPRGRRGLPGRTDRVRSARRARGPRVPTLAGIGSSSAASYPGAVSVRRHGSRRHGPRVGASEYGVGVSADPLDAFSPAVREWFAASFEHPTAAQSRGWPAIARDEHALILAPTGSGKTLAAFLWAIDRLSSELPPERNERTRVLY